jgi:sugar phosphate isomerase/epimerase
VKLGSCTSACPGRPLTEVFGKLSAAGYQAVEPFTWEGHPCHPDSFDMADGPRIRGEASDRGLEISAVSAHTTWVRMGGTADEALAFTNRSAEVAASLGAPYLNTSTGPYPPQCDRFEAWDAMRNAMLAAADHAAGLGVVLCIEPHAGHMCMTWESTLKLLREVGSPNLRLNFDASHFFILGLDHRVALEQLREYLVHVHLKDFVLRRPPLADLRNPRGNAQAVALGDGEFPLADHLRHLKALGYDGVVSAELYVDDPDTGLRRSAANVLPMVEAL